MAPEDLFKQAAGLGGDSRAVASNAPPGAGAPPLPPLPNIPGVVQGQAGPPVFDSFEAFFKSGGQANPQQRPAADPRAVDPRDPRFAQQQAPAPGGKGGGAPPLPPTPAVPDPRAERGGRNRIYARPEKLP